MADFFLPQEQNVGTSGKPLGETPTADIRPEEDFSTSGALQRVMADRKEQDTADFYRKMTYATEDSIQFRGYGAEGISPRTTSALMRYRRINALNTIKEKIPASLDRYPTLMAAAAQADIDEQDAKNIVNFLALEDAFNSFTSTSDPDAQHNILYSMPKLQRAAFFDFFTAKVEELKAEAEKDPSWASRIWNAFYAISIEPTMTGLLWVTDQGQRAYRANVAAIQNNAAEGAAVAAIPFIGPTINAVRYWDDVGPRTYDKNYIDKLKAEYETQYDENGVQKYPGAVEGILRLEELKFEGVPDYFAVWSTEMLSEGKGYLVRQLSDTKYADPALLDLVSKINTADQGNTGMLLLSGLPEQLRGSGGYDAAAASLNIIATFALDPTIVAGKAISVARAARYSLLKLSNEPGIEAAFKYRRTQNFFNALGNDFEKLRGMDAAQRSIARDIISRQYGRQMPDDALEDMFKFGVKDAETAKGWFLNNLKMTEMIDGRAALTNPWFQRIIETSQMAKRAPLLPGKSMAGVLRSRSRAIIALHNPVNKRFAEQIYDRAPMGKLPGITERDPFFRTRFAEDLAENAEFYVKAFGLVPRLGGLLEESRFGWRYNDLSVSARLDRFARNFAKAPLAREVYIADGRDANKIYNWARAFMPRHHATYIADMWRGAPNEGVRKIIFDGLMRSTLSVKGVDISTDVGKATLKELVSELRRGAVYSPKVVYEGPGTKPAAMIAAEAEDIEIPGVGVISENLVVPPDKSVTAVRVAGVEDTVTRQESLFNGENVPLHLYQTSDFLAMPDFLAMNEIGKSGSIFNQLFGFTNSRIMQGVVDLWSLGNLAGPRYFQRNFLEDFVMYSITEGRLIDFWKGHRAARAVRETTSLPRNYGRKMLGRGSKIGESRPLGIVNKALRSRRRTVDLAAARRDPDSVTKWSFIKEGFSVEDRVAAVQAMREGNVAKVRELVVIAIARMKITGLTQQNVDDLVDILTTHGMKLLDEVSETPAYGAMGGVPVSASTAVELTDNALTGVTTSRIAYPTGEYKEIALAGENPMRFVYWNRAIVGAAEYDGIIGKIAIGNLDRPDTEIVPLIARAIARDKTYGYKERLSAFYRMNASPEEFAYRYVADVRNLFSRMDGTLNRELWERIAVLQDDGTRKVAAVTRTANGEIDDTVLKVKDLAAINNVDRPQYVIGRDVSVIPMPTDIRAFDRMWSWMGQQYSRVSREPIFYGNYFRTRDMLRPYEQQLAAQVSPEYARQTVGRIAADRAYGNVLSYTDNPLDRTMLAWNSRNMARYYRATEDFARRFLRLAGNYPTGIWKAGLAYDLLEETGIVFTDENGEKYYVYPGSSQVIGVMNYATNLLFGAAPLTLDTQYELRGNVRMSAPSFDPVTWLPTASSPLSAIAFKTIMRGIPALQSFEQAILGEYTEQSDFWQAVIPGHVKRIMNQLNTDDRYTMYASAYVDAVKIAAASGAMPAPAASVVRAERLNDGSYAAEIVEAGRTQYVKLVAGDKGIEPAGKFDSFPEKQVSDTPIDENESLQISLVVAETYPGYTDEDEAAFRTSINSIVRSVMLAKFVSGLMLPAVGQITETNVTDFAREQGILSLDSAFRGLIRNATNNGSQNPVGDALIQFRELYGEDRLPLTISSTGSDNQFNTLASLTSVLATKEAGAWMKENQDLMSNHKVAAALLMPRVGEYDNDTARALNALGLKTPKSIEEAIQEARTVRGRFVLYNEREYGEAKIADANKIYYEAVRRSDQESADKALAEVKRLEQGLKQTEAFIVQRYPELSVGRTFEIDATARQRFIDGELRPMLDYIKYDRGRPIDPVVLNISEALNTFDRYKALRNSISGSTNAEDRAKGLLDTELTGLLDEIAARDPQSKYFVDVILKPMIRSQYNPQAQMKVE